MPYYYYYYYYCYYYYYYYFIIIIIIIIIIITIALTTIKLNICLSLVYYCTLVTRNVELMRSNNHNTSHFNLLLNQIDRIRDCAIRGDGG